MLSSTLRRQILNDLIKDEAFLGIYNDYDGILTFLAKIWSLRDMPSEDSRYTNAYDDARQHLVNNSDWSLEDTFERRFDLIGGKEEYFVHFLEAVVSPDVRASLESINEYVQKINNQLRPTGNQLYLADYFEELPVYKFGTLAQQGVDLPQHIRANDLVFYKNRPSPDNVVYPCFSLVYDNWNDYGIVTGIGLYYHPSANQQIDIGWVKVMARKTGKTWDVLPDRFSTLTAEFCSLGQSEEYYLDLKRHLPKNYQSVLLALRDVALFPNIAEEFENDDTFTTSLIRENDVEKNMRIIRFVLQNIDYTQAFKFNFRYRPPYTANELLFNFDFQYTEMVEHRVYGLIGKNGTGKTRLLSALVHQLGNDNTKDITPRRPLYGKIFTVSYSFFDRFDIPNASVDFNYVYCGLKKAGGGWLSEDDLKARFLASSNKIIEKKEVENWRSILANFIPNELLEKLFSWQTEWIFNSGSFNQVYQLLSSGQNILVFIIAEIMAQIRYNSLILYDEPETHLHPNAISMLMNAIFDLVKRFESFCILATHSPLVIQELQARNIYVIERDEAFASVRKLEKESFGENLTIISEDIFGNRETPKHYQQLLEELVNRGLELEEIVKRIETEDRPLSLNARLYIKSLIAERNEES
jgi:ABC-type multidrug transport system ATPase subunit